MIDPPGSTYWADWDAYIRSSLMERGLVSPGDLDLYEIVATPAEAVHKVAHFYVNFHSIRYIDGKLVVRLMHEPDDLLVEQLNDEFSSMLLSGDIHRADIHRFEREEPEVADLFRLRLHFDQKSLGPGCGR